MALTFTKSTLTATAWKNGGGLTREIATSPAGRPFWRVSIADVDRDGPFSTFPGLSRILTVIEGDGMALKWEGGSLNALPFEPTHFAGDKSVQGHLLDGPVQNFNLIFDPKLLRAQVLVGPIPNLQRVITVDCEIAMIYCITGTLRTTSVGGLPAHAGAFITHPLDFEGASDSDRALWIGLKQTTN